jgi:hypothetical protein
MRRSKVQVMKELREPGFLLWLGQFIGDWKLAGKVEVKAKVDRRDDGLLEVKFSAPRRKVPLSSVFRRGKLVKRPEGSLGCRPVILSAASMQLWLTPEKVKSLQGAWNVPAGIRRILETIEESMKAMPQAERDRRWLIWWEAGNKLVRALSGSNLTTHLMLLRRYKVEKKSGAKA